MVGLSDGGAHCGLICDASMPTFLLTHWARDRSRGPRVAVEDVVRMQTSSTAALYGFDDCSYDLLGHERILPALDRGCQ